MGIDMKSIDPFESSPEISVRFKHCGLSLTLTARVEAQDFPMLPEPGEENTERLSRICSDALREKAQQISTVVMQVHHEFERALSRAAADDHRSYLNTSKAVVKN